ncbi:unnamed protein product [Brassicogethes aeneus]|uniref:Uncharacterized protein n=1 Tax=Brassicogethes aeneus TaxID=1431903 RepID=A0A9P0B2V6_BRAAE|nr:unnamed protein product [Brassicogethes aeneus]
METPSFIGPIKNVTVAIGREAVLSCQVTELGHYKAGRKVIRQQLNVKISPVGHLALGSRGGAAPHGVLGSNYAFHASSAQSTITACCYNNNYAKAFRVYVTIDLSGL